MIPPEPITDPVPILVMLLFYVAMILVANSPR
jgi:hypothetical protein